MASKRKKEVDQHVVRDTMLKANTAALKSFESVEAEIKSKKARTVDLVARKIKETRQHLEKFAKDKLASLEKSCSGSSKLEHNFTDASKTAATIAATVSLMDKRLKDLSKYTTQADLDVKHELLGLDKKI